MEQNLGGKRAIVPLLVASLLVGSLLAPAPPALAAPQTFVVDSADDPGNNNCLTGGCTLREAITAANANAGADTIEFDIPGKGVRTITLASELPQVTDPVTIDGYSQDGASVNTKQKGTNAILLIELDGQNIDGNNANALRFNTGAQGSLVKGLVINRVENGRGIAIDADDVTVEGNFIGTNAAGTADAGNDDGATINAADARIGGNVPAARNLISGNDFAGVSIGFSSTDVVVEGNLIGTKGDGVRGLGNRIGVLVGDGASDSNIGGDQDARANVIAFNDELGVRLNANAGTGNFIRRNAIFRNGGLGIDLNADGPTLNDDGPPPDADAGPNGLQNFPVVVSAKPNKVKVTLETIPNNLVIIEFFANPKGEKEGQRFLGAILVVSDANGIVQDGQGNTTLVFAPPRPLKAGELVTATATTGPDGTSEFSKAKKVT